MKGTSNKAREAMPVCASSFKSISFARHGSARRSDGKDLGEMLNGNLSV
jgi:hypothetical protein